MEQGRLFIAIAISFLIFIVWDYLFVDREAIEQKAKQEKTQQVQDSQLPKEETDKAISTETTADTPIVEASAPVFPSQEVKSRDFVIETPLYIATVSERGAALKSLKLKDYREAASQDSPLKETISSILPYGTYLSGFKENSVKGLHSAAFVAAEETEKFVLTHEMRELAMFWKSADGVMVEKRFVFYPDSYLIGLAVSIINNGPVGIEDSVTLSIYDENQEVNRYGFTGPSALINNSLEQVKTDDLDEKNVFPGTIQWQAIEKAYFMTSILAKQPDNSAMELYVDDKILESRFVSERFDLPIGSRKQFDFQLFSGPKSMKILESYNNGLDRAIDFGWFDIIAKPCLWILNFLYGLIPNYGVAIIILTIITKIVLWPLGSKSYKSMSEMKKIQPLMAELREKYKGDKKKMNEELMKLYRVYKINPMGGCLPMLVQFPVFIALYRMLYEAIELRHAPFGLWINDLSAPDRLGDFGISIPYFQDPVGVPVLTIIMGALMFFQQRMSPPPGDPAQAKMMMFLPLIFTVIFVNFPAGLVLYWMVNNAMSIGQQYYIQKKFA